MLFVLCARAALHEHHEDEEVERAIHRLRDAMPSDRPTRTAAPDAARRESKLADVAETVRVDRKLQVDMSRQKQAFLEAEEAAINQLRPKSFRPQRYYNPLLRLLL